MWMEGIRDGAMFGGLEIYINILSQSRNAAAKSLQR